MPAEVEIFAASSWKELTPSVCKKFRLTSERFSPPALASIPSPKIEEDSIRTCPILLELVGPIEAFTVVLEYAPIWNSLLEKEPESICCPLKLVVLAILSSSSSKRCISLCKARRDSSVCPSCAAWIAFVLIVSKIFSCSSIALSATWIIPMASLAFLIACPKLSLCDRKLSAIAIPEASSAALLTRSPELSFSNDCPSSLLTCTPVVCAVSAAMFVFILKLIMHPLQCDCAKVEAIGVPKLKVNGFLPIRVGYEQVIKIVLESTFRF